MLEEKLESIDEEVNAMMQAMDDEVK